MSQDSAAWSLEQKTSIIINSAQILIRITSTLKRLKTIYADCGKLMLHDLTRSLMICEGCGRGIPLVVAPVETSQNEYKRCDHFNDWLAKFQAKEIKQIPQEVIDLSLVKRLAIGIKLDSVWNEWGKNVTKVMKHRFSIGSQMFYHCRWLLK